MLGQHFFPCDSEVILDSIELSLIDLISVDVWVGYCSFERCLKAHTQPFCLDRVHIDVEAYIHINLFEHAWQNARLQYNTLQLPLVGLVSICLMVDYCKAFDMVDHTLLL